MDVAAVRRTDGNPPAEQVNLLNWTDVTPPLQSPASERLRLMELTPVSHLTVHAPRTDCTDYADCADCTDWAALAVPEYLLPWFDLWMGLRSQLAASGYLSCGRERVHGTRLLTFSPSASAPLPSAPLGRHTFKSVRICTADIAG